MPTAKERIARMVQRAQVKSWAATALALLIACAAAASELRREGFDRDPGWDGHNNRSVKLETIRQDFGWSPATAHAGGGAGEIGGFIQPAAEPAHFAKQLRTQTLNDRLSASGRIFVAKGSGHTLLGFFNAETLNEWRTPNTIVLRINQRGDVFHCHLEHCTRRWRAGAGIIGEYDKV